MKKGGYKIINLENYSLSDVATVIDGIYETILDNYEKMLLISGMTEDDLIYDDMTGFAIIEDDNLVVTVGTKKLTITSGDEVTISNVSSGETYIAGDGIDITNNIISIDDSVAKTDLISDKWVQRTYNAGEYCIDNDILWKCLVPNSERPSEGVNWTRTNVGKELISRAQCNYPKIKIIPVIFRYSDLSIESWAGHYAGVGSVDVDLSDFKSISNIACSLGSSSYFVTFGMARLQNNNTELYCEFIRPTNFASNFEISVTLIVYGE